MDKGELAVTISKSNWGQSHIFFPMHFPPEILRYILRAATYVPGALATSYESIEEENRGHMMDAIADSMDVKRSLSLVCKTFNDMTEEYLFEIIIVRHSGQIPSLVKALRSHHNGKKSPGRWCRLIDFYIRQGRNNIDVFEVLWDLIPLCPKVVVFLCRCQFSRLLPREALFPSVAFWRTMILNWASSLRRVDIRGMYIGSNHFASLLRYFVRLEACVVVNLEPPSLDDNPSDVDVTPVIEELDSERSSSQHTDGETHAMIRQHRDAIASGWPPYNGDSPYELPHLHTLRLDTFPERLSQFSFPNLRFLSADDRSWKIRSVPDIYLRYEQAALACSASLTHFAHNIPIDIDVWKIFDIFPHLTELDVHVSGFPGEGHNPRYRQTALTRLRLFDTLTSSNFNTSVFLRLLTFVRSGMFPALEHVSILCQANNYPSVMDLLSAGQLDFSGVSVDIEWKSHWQQGVHEARRY